MNIHYAPLLEKRGRSLAYDAALFIALLATAIALGGALAHLFELPHKIALPGEEYFVVQKSYRGWSQFGYVLAVQLAAMITVVVLARDEPFVWWLILTAILCLVLAQALFWVYTYPANVATENWTHMPDNWAALRQQWEYSHAAGAVLQLLAMVSLLIAALARGRQQQSPRSRN